MNEDLVATRLTTILFSDIEGSTALKECGFDRWFTALKTHNDYFEEGVKRYGNRARIVKHLGDGYLACFDSPRDAVDFALRFQAKMLAHSWQPDLIVRSRVGMHYGQAGDVVMAEQHDIFGRAVDLAARVMSLARGGQILLTEFAFDPASERLVEGTLLGDDLPPLRWREHGEWILKGIAHPVKVFEAGLQGVAPTEPLRSGEKAYRPEDRPDPQWRPNIGARIPSNPGWMVRQHLGRGALGDVWLCENRQNKRVFRFFTEPEARNAVRALQALDAELKEADRIEISRFVETNAEQLPYYLATDYAEGRDLVTYAKLAGGLGKIGDDVRLAIVQQVVEAAAAAHRVGVLHGDIKPKNILIRHNRLDKDNKHVRTVLDDFGARRIFLAHAAPLLGQSADDPANREGALHDAHFISYVAPELRGQRNEPFTTRSDVYALGMLLYQMIVGDFTSEPGPGPEWRSRVGNEFLEKDIAECLDPNPALRPKSDELAKRLATLTERHNESEQRKKTKRSAARWWWITRLTAAALALVGLTLGAYGLAQFWAERGRTRAVKQFMIDTLRSIDPNRPGAVSEGGLTLRGYLEQARGRLRDGALVKHPGAHAEVLEALARAYLTIGDPPASLDCVSAAQDLGRQWADPPPEFQTRLQLAGARALLHRGDAEGKSEARRILESIGSSALSRELTTELAIARATLRAADWDYIGAAQAFDEAEKLLANESEPDSIQRVEMTTRSAEMYLNAARYVDAMKRAANARERLVALAAEGSGLALTALSVEGKALARQERYDEAFALLERVRSERGRMFGETALPAVYASGDLADAFERAEKWEEAAQCYAPCYQYAMRPDADHSLQVYFATKYGLVLAKCKRDDEAAAALQLSRAAFQRLKPADRESSRNLDRMAEAWLGMLTPASRPAATKSAI